MSDALLSKIAKHIKDNERIVPHPYLDSNGHVTIGADFKTLRSEGSRCKIEV